MSRGAKLRVMFMGAGLLAFVLMPFLAHAQVTSSGMPEWEGPLGVIVTSLRGPVALGMSIMGVVVAGAMLVWGGELGDFARRMVMLVLAIAIMLGAASIVTRLWSSSVTASATSGLGTATVRL